MSDIKQLKQDLQRAFCEVISFYLVGVNPANDQLLYKFQPLVESLLESDSWVDNPEAEAFLSVRTQCTPMNQRLEKLAHAFRELQSAMKF